MKYTTVDFKKWKRAGLFKFYIDNMRIVMSLTADIDDDRPYKIHR